MESVCTVTACEAEGAQIDLRWVVTGQIGSPDHLRDTCPSCEMSELRKPVSNTFDGILQTLELQR